MGKVQGTTFFRIILYFHGCIPSLAQADKGKTNWVLIVTLVIDFLCFYIFKGLKRYSQISFKLQGNWEMSYPE